MHIAGEPPKLERTEVSLTFDDSDLEGVTFAHHDSLVIMPMIGNNEVKSVLIDNEASVDILFMMRCLRWATSIRNSRPLTCLSMDSMG